jgi:hypothetical protein
VDAGRLLAAPAERRADLQLQQPFRRLINPRDFQGTITFEEPRLVTRPGEAPLMFMQTSLAFWDDRGGVADGTVKIALTNPPVAGASS